MIGIYFRTPFPETGSSVSVWLSEYCKEENGSRIWKWIRHPDLPGVWGMLLPDRETLVALKLRYPIQTFGEFDNNETPEQFVNNQFDLSWG